MKKDISVPLIVMITALAFLDPFMYLMPSMMVSFVLGILMIATVVYGLIIFKENAQDEREVAVRAFADRHAGLVGTIGLVLVIVYQVLVVHHVDAVIVLILLAMLITKYVAHVYAEKHL
ncbi:hypothetical protein K2P47_02280 [Patescibacteria group bacterium]|nr:hypothetical protein [Patescibacteria group bacterium]